MRAKLKGTSIIIVIHLNKSELLCQFHYLIDIPHNVLGQDPEIWKLLENFNISKVDESLLVLENNPKVGTCNKNLTVNNTEHFQSKNKLLPKYPRYCHGFGCQQR